MKCRTPNGRFGASGAVARPKVCANLEVLRPSERQWKPRLPQAAGTLEASLWERLHLYEKMENPIAIKWRENSK